ncbi:hypothetical protein TH53_17975 [Pedobacter lusitanus]|uniref:Uncharacterized protein n=1 Tax=Pedobacter lusitanus TaxID=1503925 RepID=A0A0D0GIM9_9SPHI|nr:hypothetical protein [Pedobacter lusitanus]KIO75950.1 hypothetical protein TH53_17975 [Pedobacter lusitanus]
MADGGIIFPINFITNGDPVFENIKKGLKTIDETIQKTTKSIGDLQKVFSLKQLTSDLNKASESFINLRVSFAGAIQAGRDVINAARAQPDQAQGMVGIVSDSVDKLGTFVGQMGTVTSDMGGVMQTMGQVSGSIGELSSNLGGAMGNVGELMTKLGGSMENMGGVSATIGNVVGNIGGYASTIGDTLGGVGEVMDTVNKSMGSVGGLVDGIGKSMGSLGTVISTVGSGIKNIIPAISAVGTAIMSIPGIGWIIAGIVAVVVAVKLLWDNSQRFREILFSIWEVAQAVFYNIGIVINRVWELIIKPAIDLLWNGFSAAFGAVMVAAQWAWDVIGGGLQWLWSSVIMPVATFIWDLYTGIFLGIWNVIKSVFTAIYNFISAIWTWITKTFSGFAKWITDTLIKPIREAFSGIWKWITDLFDGIMAKIMKLIKPIKELWNKIFSSDGMKDLKVAAEEGKEKGRKSFEDSQNERNKGGESGTEKKGAGKDAPKDAGLAIPSFNLKVAPALPAMSPIGGVAATQVMNSTSAPNKGTSTQNVGNLNITKLVENLNIYNQNGTTMSKESMVAMVKDALLTAVADFSLVKAQ